MKQTTFAALAALTTAFVVAIILCLHSLWLPQAVFAATDVKMTVVLDAGHGGIDGGVTGKTTGIKESEVNLAITLALKEELTDMGFEVILTRKTDAGLYDTTAKGFKKRDMQRRKEIIEEADPSMVISLHQNFYPTKNTRGGQVFYRKESTSGQRLAVLLQKGLNALYKAEGARERKAASGQFFMLECAECPSVLVECGFLSNREDERLLTDVVWQNDLAKTLADGVMEYFSDISA